MGQWAWLTQLRGAWGLNHPDQCPAASAGLRWSLPEAPGAPRSLLGRLTPAPRPEVIRRSPELRGLGLWLPLA